MTILRERVVSLLLSNPGRTLCVACVAKRLGVRHKNAHEAMLKLEARPGFRRGYGVCSECAKTRMVSAATDGAKPRAAREGGDR